MFVAGIVLLIVETTHDDVRTIVVLIGLLMAGLPIAAVIDRALGGTDR